MINDQEQAFLREALVRKAAPREKLLLCLRERGEKPDGKIWDICVARGVLTAAQVAAMMFEKTSSPSELGIPGYEILGSVGKGAMGEVFKARQAAFGRIVALKVLLPELAGKEILRKRFEREIRAAGVLNHPNIIKGLDVGEAAGRLYLAMEFAEGGSTRDLITANPAGVPEERVLRIARETLLGLAHAGKAGILHRDLKPANILLDGKGAAKISDFGLVKFMDAADALTRTGARLGTPYYMAPEQIRAEKDLDARCDLYALGAGLYHLLAGRPPFLGATSMIVFNAHLNDPVRWDAAALARVSPASRVAVERLLAKDRSARPRDAREALALLPPGA